MDLMQVQISKDNGMTWEMLKQLNPITNPVGGAANIPYSSAGFNQPGVWMSAGFFDLQPYSGQIVQIGFAFNSVSNNQNGFEGWYIDDLTIRTQSLPPPTRTPTKTPTRIPTPAKSPTMERDPIISTVTPTLFPTAILSKSPVPSSTFPPFVLPKTGDTSLSSGSWWKIMLVFALMSIATFMVVTRKRN
jgi:hypothetical protein